MNPSRSSYEHVSSIKLVLSVVVSELLSIVESSRSSMMLSASPAKKFSRSSMMLSASPAKKFDYNGEQDIVRVAR
jgi:hypothetical protein